MDNNEQHVSTEAQRMALEAMSAQLVHKLNAMISEQEERARVFAAQHHSMLSTPLPLDPEQPQAPTTPAPERQEAQVNIPPAPRRKLRKNWEMPSEPAPAAKPMRIGPETDTAKEGEQGGNIGMGMIIFALVGIIILLRSCT